MLVTQLCDPMDCSPQAPLPMGFAKQEYWSELPFSSPGDLPDPGIESRSPALQADSTFSATREAQNVILISKNKQKKD